MDPISISVVIPAYNEELAIGPLLEVLPSQLSSTCIEEAEIIVVDDGSSDKTAEIVGAYSYVTLLRHNVRRGYGAALKSGMLHATHSVICITDADGTYPNDQIAPLIEELQAGKWDMVVAARTGESVSIPHMRRPAKWMLNQFANMVAGERIPDLNSGLRVFRRRAVQQFLNILPDGFSFTTTITLAMLTNGYLVSYVPVSYFPRVGHSKIRPLRDTMAFFQLITRIALYFAPLKVFLPISVFFLLLGLAWGTYTYFDLGKLADLSTLVICMTGVQIGVMGLLAELINRRLPNVYQE